MTDQQALGPEASGNLPQTNTDLWRKEIHARVAGYRTRRGRRVEGAYSMRFPFPPLEPDVSGSATRAPTDSPNQEQAVAASTASVVPVTATEVASSEVCDLAPQLVAGEPEVSSTESSGPAGVAG